MFSRKHKDYNIAPVVEQDFRAQVALDLPRTKFFKRAADYAHRRKFELSEEGMSVSKTQKIDFKLKMLEVMKGAVEKNDYPLLVTLSGISLANKGIRSEFSSLLTQAKKLVLSHEKTGVAPLEGLKKESRGSMSSSSIRSTSPSPEVGKWATSSPFFKESSDSAGKNVDLALKKG